MLKKQDVLDEVTSWLGLAQVKVSSGSTEPRLFFELVVELLGLETGPAKDKPGLARCIVEAAGFSWLPKYESRGSTVTLNGLIAVRDAVMLLTASVE